MSHAELVLRPDSVTAGGEMLDIMIRLPHYRSLPLSCLMDLEVTLDGVPADRDNLTFTIAGHSYKLADVADWHAREWFLQDPLIVHLPREGRSPGVVIDVEVAVTIRLPYVIIEPFGPLERRVVAHRPLTIGKAAA
ncbi:MAG TPA: DUF6379 domain-containing protein [Microbacterium sp.]|uniref:C-glycoside deglycosidase beta subunit domain-containing protein n=1 Tax=Microbacterium sp. TaxID=51671 RepID=UPI002B557D5D|nr:DUF6379 domain-containing protein [Microbacterium sp.]HWI30582.1 DUF6379 domain-containing protein [Microbacterium sp.]